MPRIPKTENNINKTDKTCWNETVITGCWKLTNQTESVELKYKVVLRVVILKVNIIKINKNILKRSISDLSYFWSVIK